MDVLYNLYSNGGSGGPVDYSTAIASTRDVSLDVGPLASPGDYTFAVRASDALTGLEEANTDAIVHLVIDGTGRDVTGIPGPPHALVLTPDAGGGCRVSWAFRSAGSSGRPSDFQVTVAPEAAGSHGSVSATVLYVSGRVGYSCRFQGPFELGSYTATVRSRNAAGLDKAVLRVSARVGQTGQPLMMDPVNILTSPTGPA